MITISFTIPDEHAPALRSAVQELSEILGTRLETCAGPKDYLLAQTRAADNVAKLRAAVNAALGVQTKAELDAVSFLRAEVHARIRSIDPHYSRGGT